MFFSPQSLLGLLMATTRRLTISARYHFHPARCGHCVMICNALVTGEITGPCQLVAPAALQRRLFDTVHAGPLAGHLGPKRTLHQLPTTGLACAVMSVWYRQYPQCNRSELWWTSVLVVFCSCVCRCPVYILADYSRDNMSNIGSSSTPDVTWFSVLQ